MKILLDECLPRRLVRDLGRHSVTTVPRQGWAGTKDVELIRLAEEEFDVFITMDSNLSFQQNLSATNICVVVLCAANSRYETLEPLLPAILNAIENARHGEVTAVS
jgi:predicted nuclease of predicted toxin-antitoxin system